MSPQARLSPCPTGRAFLPTGNGPAEPRGFRTRGCEGCESAKGKNGRKVSLLCRGFQFRLSSFVRAVAAASGRPSVVRAAWSRDHAAAKKVAQASRPHSWLAAVAWSRGHFLTGLTGLTRLWIDLPRCGVVSRPRHLSAAGRLFRPKVSRCGGHSARGIFGNRCTQPSGLGWYVTAPLALRKKTAETFSSYNETLE